LLHKCQYAATGATWCRVAADNNQKSALDRSVLQGQNLTLNSSTSDSRRVVRAIFRLDVPNNFITQRIVHKLGLVVCKDPRFTMEVSSAYIHLLPTDDYVDLACYSLERKSDFIIYRFYVVKHNRFDLLFGAGSVISGEGKKDGNSICARPISSSHPGS
jgi:hypothetical protein